MTDLRIKFWVVLNRVFERAANFCLGMAIRIKFSHIKHTS